MFQHIWRLYFSGSIGRYAGHPFDNFVVAKGVSRLGEKEIEDVVRECKAVAGARGLISESDFSFTMNFQLTSRNGSNECFASACRSSEDGHVGTEISLSRELSLYWISRS